VNSIIVVNNRFGMVPLAFRGLMCFSSSSEVVCQIILRFFRTKLFCVDAGKFQLSCDC
jgi:hypothetical protein